MSKETVPPRKQFDPPKSLAPRWASHLLGGLAISALTAAAALGQTRTVNLHLNLHDTVGAVHMGRFSLAQGGQSGEPFWEDRIPEVRALRPGIIRFFAQPYFDPLVAPGRYDWRKMDETVNMVLKTGAEALMDITLKPKLLYPKVDPKITDPTSWEQWDDLMYHMARHYKGRVRYYEVGDEGEIGEGGGCPYFFTPAAYGRYYQHTVEAIRRADPEAKVGGPTVVDCHSPMLPAFLSFCETVRVPLDFVSWHLYDNNPQDFGRTIEYVKSLFTKHHYLHPKLFFDEWNMSLDNPPLDPRFQPCFIAEVAYQMIEGGVDDANYYQIRDFHVDPKSFAQFMSPWGTRHMRRWWNRTSQFDGLFDFQNRVRPAYFVFRLLSYLTGERLRLESSDPGVHGFAAWDPMLDLYNVLVWNFSPTPAQVHLEVDGAPSDLTLQQRVLDAVAASDDENVRLRPLPPQKMKPGPIQIWVQLSSYGVRFLSLEKPL